MNELPVTLMQMQLSDVKAGMRLSTAEGWNQTEKDWKFLIANSQNICLAAEADDKVVGTTTATNYANQLAWIGMVLVDKNYRGKGISKMLLENVLEKLKQCRSIKLDATSAGREVYKKFGFKDEYSITRMTCSSIKSSFENDGNAFAQSIQSKDIKAITEFDEIVFGANRTKLIEYFTVEYFHKAWLLKRDNKLTAFALGREGNKFHHIGPVIGETIDDVKILISKALKEINGQQVVLDVLNDKFELINWLQSLGFTRQREFVRMYKNENPFPGLTEKYFLICGPEFG
jgi:ribosomal protein S18 acetylase RimI-like enzyme